MKIYRKYIEINIHLFLLPVFAVEIFAWSSYNKNDALFADDTSDSNEIREERRELENNINLKTLRALLDLAKSTENKYLGNMWLKPSVFIQDNNGIPFSQSSSVGIPDSISNEKSSNEYSDDKSRNNYESSEESNGNTILGASHHDLKLNLRGSVDLSLHLGGISASRKPIDSSLSNSEVYSGEHSGSESQESNYNNNGTSKGNSENSGESINESANRITVAPESNEQSNISSSNNNRLNNQNVNITTTYGNNELSSNEEYNNTNKNNTQEAVSIEIPQEENNDEKSKNNTVSLNSKLLNNNTNSVEKSSNFLPFENCAILNYLYEIQDDLICEFLQYNNIFFYNLCCNINGNS